MHLDAPVKKTLFLLGLYKKVKKASTRVVMSCNSQINQTELEEGNK